SLSISPSRLTTLPTVLLASRWPGPTPPFSFFFHAPPPPETYTLSLHDALPISAGWPPFTDSTSLSFWVTGLPLSITRVRSTERRSEEHTSELQSRGHLVCRLLLEKKNMRRSVPGRGRQHRHQARADDGLSQWRR